MIMKKYFIFAAIATAGLFASCSSSDDVAVSDGQEPIENPEAREAIRLNLATPTAMTTRGTGTVGGVGTSGDANYIANVWSGQSINVFMFTKGTEATAAVLYADAAEYNADKGTNLSDDEFAALTEAEKTKTPAGAADPYATTLNLTPAHEPGATATTYLYDNTEMITPGSASNKIPGENTDNDGSGEAMIKDGTIQYYPPQGNFDFFGYHVDKANTAGVDKTTAPTTLWTIPFTIDGTQDLMSTKAVLTGDENTANTQAKIMHDAGTRSKDYYSAYAARKNVHPTLTFKHLLTRLQFSIIAGNDAAAGWVPAGDIYYTAAEAAAYNADPNNVAGCLISTDEAYDFTAGPEAAADPQWSTSGVALVTGATTDTNSDPYTVVKIIKNVSNNTVDASIFLNHTFAVKGDDINNVSLSGDGLQLYNVTGTGTNADPYVLSTAFAGVFIKTLAPTDHDTYNASLTGAVSTSTVKTAGAPAHQDVEKAVKVTKIQVLSENTKGDLAVAWTAADMTDPNKITWGSQPDEDNRWLTLMERPVLYNQNANVTIEDADIEGYTTMAADALTAAKAAATAQIDAAVYATLSTAGKAKYTPANVNNENLVGLTPTCPNITSSGVYPPTRVGESIILSPGKYDANGVAQIGDPLANTQKLRMKVTLAQNVPTNWNHPEVLTPKTQEYELDIPAPLLSTSGTDKGFKQNTSYNIKLTVYGLERIEVIAVVEPWVDGGDIPVGADD